MVKKYFNYRANKSKRTRSICREQPIMHFVKALFFEWRKKRAIRKAQHDADMLRKKFLVIVFNGKPVVVSMQGLKSLIHKHRFARGFSAEKATQLAIYTAFPSKK